MDYLPVRPSNGIVDLQIVTGPKLFEFLTATLKGGSGIVEFTVRSDAGQLRGTLPVGTSITVEIHTAECEDGSGHLFNFTGTYQGRKVAGFYDAHDGRTGHMNFADNA